jgi:hypothetical protein
VSTASRGRLASRVSIWSLTIAVAAVAWAATASTSWALDDKMKAPGAVKGEETSVFVKPDAAAGELGRQGFEILGNDSLACDRVDLRGAIFAPIVGRVTFRSVEFGDCTYLGMDARLNTTSCEVPITSGGLGRFMDAGTGTCSVKIEAPGCTIHLGKGPFLELGYHNEGAPIEITALTEPIPIGGTAVGPVCPSPGPDAIAQYHGYLRFGASRDGEQEHFTVIL